jgi:beta-glucosidase
MQSQTIATPREQIQDGMTANGFWWMTGFEGSNIPEIGADEYEWTQHYANWQQDLEQVRQRLDLTRIRYTLPWYRLNPAPGRYDWRWADRVMAKAEELGLDLVLNPIQFGTPAWLQDSFGNLDFPDYAAEYFNRVARRYGRQAKFYTPHNEPLISALFGGDFGHWPPYWKGLDNYVRLVNNIGRQIVQSTRAVLQEVPEAQMIHVEAAEHYAAKTPDPFVQKEIWLRNERRFLFLDLVSGQVRKDHPLSDWLATHGMSDSDLAWFAENAINLDVIGVDYYPHCEVWLNRRENELIQHRDHGFSIVHHFSKTNDSARVNQLADLPVGLTGMLELFRERYNRPLMITEIDYCGLNEHKTLFLRYTVQEVKRARAAGIPVIGYTWWPAIDHMNWDLALRERDHIHPVGLWELHPEPDGRLSRVETEVVAAYRDLKNNAADSVGEVASL